MSSLDILYVLSIFLVINHVTPILILALGFYELESRKKMLKYIFIPFYFLIDIIFIEAYKNYKKL